MWQYWSIRELQEEIGVENLQFLEIVLPEFDQTAQGGGFLSAKQKLVELVSSLKDHDFFRKKKNLLKGLVSLPPDVKSGLLNQLDLPVEIGDDEISKHLLSNRESLEIFVDFFGLDKRFLAEEHPSLEPYFESLPASATTPKEITKPYKKLKSYQAECIMRLSKKLGVQSARAILQMPTGSGKTRTSMEVLVDHLNDDRSRHVVWLANTRELCEQAIQCFVEVWDHEARYPVRINRLWGDYTSRVVDFSNADRSFSVVSMQAAWSILSKNPNHFSHMFGRTSLVIVDEAHIAVARTYAAVIKRISHDTGCVVLGLTATPGRTIESEVTELSDLFFNQIVSLQDPNRNRDDTIAFLRSIGVMSAASHYPIKYTSQQRISANEMKKFSDGEDFSESFLKKLGEDPDRVVALIRKVKNLLDQGAKIILFAPSVNNSFLTSSILTFLGYKSAHISSQVSTSARDSIINAFVEGEYQILCNYGVLSTGFDAPSVDVVCIARPTKSPVLYSQMIGRGLRGTAVGGTGECMVLEVIDNFVGHGEQSDLYRLFDNYWGADGAA